MKMRQIEIHFMQLIVITLIAHVATGACSRVKHNKGQCCVAAELTIQVLLFLKQHVFYDL
jgi:hypothetical protein